MHPLFDHHALKGFGDSHWGPMLQAAGLYDTSMLMRVLVDCLAALAFDHIWLPRCDATAAWERLREIFCRQKSAMLSSGQVQPSHLTFLPPATPLDYHSVEPAGILS